MIILGIETSCDETAASVIKDGREILSHIVASSAEMHIKTGGIIPEQAAREQIKSIIPVIEEALKVGIGWTSKESRIPPIDAIAVTAGGPGLIGSMLVGVETAKTLSFVWNKPVVPVVHLLGHVYANWLIDNKQQTANDIKKQEPKFPLVFLTVSGGHSDLFYTEQHGKFKWIGGTRDDAAGEAFDKTARLLGLPYPGGPSIAVSATKFEAPSTKFENIKLPRPMINEDNFDFSFSGLKTAILREVNKLKAEGKLNENAVNFLAFEVQEAICDVLVEKTLKAVEKNNVSTLLLAGGVSANQRLREKFDSRILDLDLDFRVPPPFLCTDNASFIAGYAHYNYNPLPWQEIKAVPNADQALEAYGISKG